jgi:hypothetical protein
MNTEPWTVQVLRGVFFTLTGKVVFTSQPCATKRSMKCLGFPQQNGWYRCWKVL